VTARNYAAQAQRSLRDYSQMLATRRFPHDSALLKSLTDRFGESVHFAVPDSGAILDTGFRGLEDGLLRLPFPEITIEYFVPYMPELLEDRSHAPKRIIYAREIDPANLPGWLPPVQREMIGATLDKWAKEMPHLGEGKHGILIWAASLMQPSPDTDAIWCPEPGFWLLPERYPEYAEHSDTLREVARTRPTDPNAPFPGGRRPIVVGGMIPAMLEMVQRAMSISPRGEDQVLADFQRDISLEAGVVLEFIEAFSCSNIQASTLTAGIDPKVSKRREADGKLPMFETKVLTLDVPGRVSGGTSGAGGSGRASPRMHMRRGHIRRLDDGRRIWVNNAVIGSQSHGQIQKSYAIQTGDASRPRERG
jgi:hypothetical protein